jgi:hypothetical protein
LGLWFDTALPQFGLPVISGFDTPQIIRAIVLELIRDPQPHFPAGTHNGDRFGHT